MALSPLQEVTLAGVYILLLYYAYCAGVYILLLYNNIIFTLAQSRPIKFLIYFTS